MPKAVERIRKNCLICGNEFKTLPNAKAIMQKYCSNECFQKSRITLPECNCVYCGKLFQPKFADRMKYCSKECKIEYKELNRQANKEMRDKKLKEQRNMQKEYKANKEFICKQCGDVFKHHNGIYTNDPLYCSENCSKESQKNNELINRFARKKHHMCKVCGKEFKSEYGVKLSKCCSKECQKIYIKDHLHNYRVMRRKAFIKHVNSHQIFKRDNYTCQLCYLPLDMKAKIYSPLSPSIDHIIPIANGGKHEPSNVQSAHFMCNSIKGNKHFGEKEALSAIKRFPKEIQDSFSLDEFKSKRMKAMEHPILKLIRKLNYLLD